MSLDVQSTEGQKTRQTIGRLNPHWHPRIAHHPWTPLSYVLAALAVALMLVVLIVVLTFAFSAGKL